MDLNISLLKEKIQSKDLVKEIEAVDEIIGLSNKLNDIILSGLETTTDSLIFTDRVSMLFGGYLQKLSANLSSDNEEIAFWSASLLVHHGVTSEDAETIMLKALKSGNFTKVSTASQILRRTKNPKLVSIISEIVENDSTDNEIRKMLLDKISGLQE